MPVYEYQPVDWDCLICQGRFEVIQSVTEQDLEFCPTCGMEVRRVISKAQIKVARTKDFDKAGEKGFTVFRRAEKGKWERVAGQGVDMIVGTPEDVAAVEAEKQKPVKRVNLDE